MKEIKVFVYGTLKRGNLIRGLDRIDGARFIGPAETINDTFMMLDLGSFPAVIPAQPSWMTTTKISGEVFAVTAPLFKQLDVIEGYPDFYNRMLVETTQGVAWMYYLNSMDYADFYEDSIRVVIKDGVTHWAG